MDIVRAIIAGILAIFFLIVTVTCGGNGGSVGVSGGSSADFREIQDAVYAKYKSLIPRGKMSFNDFCYPTKYRVQPQQKFAAEYMAPAGKRRECLIFHKIGAGKTCLAIQICMKWLNRGRPLVVMPASLIPGFYNELRSKCAGDLFISEEEREKLAATTPGSAEYSAIISASNGRIDAAIHIYSYNKFVNGAPDAPLLIVDEVQNINNTSGKTYSAVKSWVNSHPSACVVIMSGTPIFDSPREVSGLATLLRRRHPTSAADTREVFAGIVSYFGGAPAFTYPHVELKIKQCVFSPFQSRWYQSQIEAERKGSAVRTYEISNNFYIKSRQRSDVVYPHGIGGRDSAGLSEMTAAHLGENLATYSAKGAALMKRLRRGELSFVYSSFTTTLAFLCRVLDAAGWKNFTVDGPGKKRYAVWSGDTPASGKDVIRATFNDPANDDGSKLRVILGSPSIKEGVSLMRVRAVHVMEAYWNHSRLEQIYGRAVRYCSHKSLPKSERTVDIIIYAGVTRRVRAIEEVGPEVSVDLYMLMMADKKRAECAEYSDALIECAVDKYLWN